MLKSEAENHGDFLSPRRRAQVRLVLAYLGVPATMGNYRKYESIINWEEFSRNLLDPSFTAFVDIIDAKGNVHGRTVADLRGSNRAEALKNIDPGYKFVDWV